MWLVVSLLSLSWDPGPIPSPFLDKDTDKSPGSRASGGHLSRALCCKRKASSSLLQKARRLPLKAAPLPTSYTSEGVSLALYTFCNTAGMHRTAETAHRHAGYLAEHQLPATPHPGECSNVQQWTLACTGFHLPACTPCQEPTQDKIPTTMLSSR